MTSVRIVGNVRWCPAFVSVGVPGIIRIGRPVCQCVTWAVLDGCPAACQMQPYLDYNYILAHPRNYCKYFLQFIAFLYLLIILSSTNKCIGRKRYLSRPILSQKDRGTLVIHAGGALKLKSVNFLTARLSTDNSRH